MSYPEKLYHGTSQSNWDHIRDYGCILSRGSAQNHGNKSNWEIPSNPYAVYLTTCYAPYFAMNASEENEPWVILEIDTSDLDEESLLPDEDVLEQASRGHDLDFMPASVAKSDDMKLRTLWFRDNIQLFQHIAEPSLGLMGTIAYYKSISTDSITSYGIVDPKTYPVLCGMVDPQITIMNHSVMGNVYNALTRAMLGQRVKHEDLFVMGSYELMKISSQESLDKLSAEINMIPIRRLSHGRKTFS